MYKRRTPPPLSWDRIPLNIPLEQVATILGRSSESTRQLMASGELNGVKQGGKWHCAKSVLQRYMGEKPSLTEESDLNEKMDHMIRLLEKIANR